MYRSETFYTYKKLVKRLNEGIRPDQIVGIINAGDEPSNPWVLIYTEDGKNYEKEPCNDAFMNKTCVSSGVCEHDKQRTLDKIRAELIQAIQNGTIKIESGTDMLFRIIELYKAESEV